MFSFPFTVSALKSWMLFYPCIDLSLSICIFGFDYLSSFNRVLFRLERQLHEFIEAPDDEQWQDVNTEDSHVRYITL